MPFARFQRRLKAAREQAEEKLKNEERRHRLGLWVQAKTLYSALVADKPVPQTKAEQNKKASDGELMQAKRSRQEHDAQWLKALSHPYHLEEAMGLMHVFQAPPEPKVMTAEEVEAERQRILQDAAMIWS